MIIDIVLVYAEGRGGMEYVITEVSQELSKRGHRVRIFQAGPPKFLEWEDSLPEIFYYDPVQLGYQTAYDGEIDLFRYALGYRSMIKQLGLPDVVIATHSPLQSLICKMALSYLGNDRPPILSWLHGPPEAFGGAVPLKYSDSHLAISYGVASKISNSFPNRVSVHYVGNPANIQEVARLPRPDEGTEFLYIGRLDNKQKRIDLLLQALSKLEGNWNLTVIGDGPDRAALVELATQLNLSNSIQWLGWKDEPWKEILSCSLLLLPSDYEGFGLVLVEALARGIPVIATNCEGPTDIIQDGINGWLFPVGETIALQNLLRQVVTGKLKLPSQDICEASAQKFRIDNVVNRFEKAIVHTKAFYKTSK